MKIKKAFLLISLLCILATLLISRENVQAEFELTFIAIINNFLKNPSASIYKDSLSQIPGRLQDNPTFTKPDSEIRNQLDAWFDSTNTDALIFFRDDSIVYERYSLGSDSGRNVNGMSLQKVITALLIGIAIDEKLIKSEKDHIKNYIKSDLPTYARDLTFHNLLTHTSGIESSFSNLNQTLSGKELNVDEKPLKFKETRTFKYDNMNYHLLSSILKNIYNLPLNQIIEKKIWGPLQLDKAYIQNSAGYCCVFATARSWLSIGKLFIDPNQRIISSEWLQKMISSPVDTDKFYVQATNAFYSNKYGYHIYSGLAEYPNTFWMEGVGLQLLIINPIEKSITVRLGDMPTFFSRQNIKSDNLLINQLLSI